MFDSQETAIAATGEGRVYRGYHLNPPRAVTSGYPE